MARWGGLHQSPESHPRKSWIFVSGISVWSDSSDWWNPQLNYIFMKNVGREGQPTPNRQFL